MKKLTIEQEGTGILELSSVIPSTQLSYLLDTAIPVSLQGEGFHALFQLLTGKGFQVWFSRYWMVSNTILKANGDIPTLELRISLRNKIKGKWENIAQAALPAYHYQFGFVPHVVTRGVFEAKPGEETEYQTFDIHFDISFLEDMGMDYKTFQQFIELVLKSQPAELLPEPRRCPPLMIEAIHAILNNNYTIKGKEKLLHNSVENILLAALEDADSTGMIVPHISPAQHEALHEVKRLIEQSIPYYPGNKQLCQKTCLNLFILNFGFKRLFGENPKRYATVLRMEKAKELLRQGESVQSVAMTLDYDSGRAFGKAFKEFFGLTPKEYQLTFRH